MIQMNSSEDGRVVVPIEIRKALGLQVGDAPLRELADDEAYLTTRRERIRRAQALVSQYGPNVDLRPTTRSLGLSLGDHSCLLALAHLCDLVAMTADQAWQQLDQGLGTGVDCIRYGLHCARLSHLANSSREMGCKHFL